MSVKKINEVSDHEKMREFLVNLMNQSFGAAGLTIGGTSTKIKIAAAITFRIAGIPYAKAITDNITVTAGAVQAVSTFCKYLVSINAAGTVTVTKGDDAATAVLALVPALPANNAPVGYVQVATDAATTFTAGTTALDAAGITDTYGDISCVVTES